MHHDQFELVCNRCGSLTVALPSAVECAPLVMLNCGRCGAPRGTLQALRELSVSYRYFEAQMQGVGGLSPVPPA